METWVISQVRRNLVVERYKVRSAAARVCVFQIGGLATWKDLVVAMRIPRVSREELVGLRCRLTFRDSSLSSQIKNVSWPSTRHPLIFFPFLFPFIPLSPTDHLSHLPVCKYHCRRYLSAQLNSPSPSITVEELSSFFCRSFPIPHPFFPVYLPA